MKLLRTLITVLVCGPYTATQSAAQSTTAADLVRFATIGDPQELGTGGDEGLGAAAGIFSPDGERVAVVVRSGNLEQQSNDATLLVYRTAELLRDARPYVAARMSSTINAQPMAKVQWLADSETLVFAGTRGELASQVYRVNVRTGGLDELTRETARLVWYDVTSTGDLLVTLTEDAAKSPFEDELCRLRGCLVTANSLWEAERGSPEVGLSVADLRTGDRRAMASPQALDPALHRCVVQGAIPPNRRSMFWLCHIRELPRWLGELARTQGSLQRSQMGWTLERCWRERHERCFRRAVLQDLRDGTLITSTEILLYASQATSVWIDDGRYIILSGVLNAPSVKLADQAGEPALAAASGSLVAIDSLTGSTTRIAAADVVTGARPMSWDAQSQTLTVQVKGSEGTDVHMESYKRTARNWIRVAPQPDAPKAHERPQLVVEQSLNDRPILFAMDSKSGAKRRLLDPNGWLSARALGRVEELTWSSKDGSTWHGGLYYPVGYRRDTRYPLVLQTHGFLPGIFSLDGRARNFAGRALSAHGIIVLQIHEWYGKELATRLRTVQGGYEGAIDHLDRLGLIDPNRVGIQGWSATGPTAAYLMTHSCRSIAAGVFGGTGTFGPMHYLFTWPRTYWDSLYGEGQPPWGEGLKSWLKHSPSLNLDRVRTPTLIWNSGGVSALWEWYAGLRHIGKPAEYWLLPDGSHDVFQVGQRMLTGELVVDWFRFWLTKEEDISPLKDDQYARWRKFREQQLIADKVTSKPMNCESAT